MTDKKRLGLRNVKTLSSVGAVLGGVGYYFGASLLFVGTEEFATWPINSAGVVMEPDVVNSAAVYFGCVGVPLGLVLSAVVAFTPVQQLKRWRLVYGWILGTYLLLAITMVAVVNTFLRGSDADLPFFVLVDNPQMLWLLWCFVKPLEFPFEHGYCALPMLAYAVVQGGLVGLAVSKIGQTSVTGKADLSTVSGGSADNRD